MNLPSRKSNFDQTHKFSIKNDMVSTEYMEKFLKKIMQHIYILLINETLSHKFSILTRSNGFNIRSEIEVPRSITYNLY